MLSNFSNSFLINWGYYIGNESKPKITFNYAYTYNAHTVSGTSSGAGGYCTIAQENILNVSFIGSCAPKKFTWIATGF